MELERFIAFIIISVIMGIGKKFLKFTFKILIVGIIIVAIVIYKDNIINFIQSVISSGDKLALFI